MPGDGCWSRSPPGGPESEPPQGSRRTVPAGSGVGGMADIRLDAGFFDHPKTKRLMRRLGIEGGIALLKLWIYASRYFPKGILTGLTAADVVEAAEWSGASEEFVPALIEAGGPGKAGFLDVVDGVFVLHNWKIRNRYAYFKPERSEQARRANDVRWSKRRKEKQEVNPVRTPDRNPPFPPPPPKSKSKDPAADAAGSLLAGRTEGGNGSDHTSPKSRRRGRKEYPPEALSLYAYFCETVVKVPSKKADALRNITARLKEGFTEQQLGQAIAHYATECDEKKTPEDRRFHPNNFFGQKSYFSGFLPELESGQEEVQAGG